jgi:putative selenate reductase FAD-binding subunit
MITKYHRPLLLADAIDLIALPNTTIIAGGTAVNADTDSAPLVAVDLQALDLSGIESDKNTVHIGATTRLQDLVDSELVPELLRDLARREAPNTIRNAATVGGTVGTADPESELLAGLLVYGATVTLARSGSQTEQTLDEVLDDPQALAGAIITAVTINAAGVGSAERTARTPMDRPIVMAVALHGNDGTTRLAMTGVADRPVIVDPAHISDLQPPSDFRGSSAYRKHIASVLADRVLTSLRGGE